MKDAKLNRLLFWKKRCKQAETSLNIANHRLSNTQAALAQSQENEKRLNGQLEARNAVLEGAKQALGNARRELSKLQDLGIEAWACPNSPENPVCISTPGDSTEGHSLNLYVRGGVIVGVTVHERETGKLVTAAGLVAHDPNG